MKFFKDAENKVFAFEADGSQDFAISPDLTAITQAEADELRKPKISADEMLALIKAERDRRKAGGVLVGSKWFHTDADSRIQQIGLAMMGANLPANLQWKTLDGSFVTMTPALAQGIFTGVAASDQTIFGAAEKHRVAMLAAADPASYDYSGGWPKVYGE